MGVSFTRFLTPTHTHLVSAVSSGEKFERAAEWGIHVVNSLWLEECFVKWERVREAQVRFMTFGTGVGVNGSVGDVTRWVSEAEIGLTMDEKAKLIRHTSLSNAEKTVMEKASANAKETDKMPGGKQNGAAYISPLGQSSRIAAVAQSSVSPAPKTPTPQTQQQQQEPKSSKTAATVTSTTKKKRALEPVTELLSSGGTKKRSRLATTSPTSSEELRVIFTGCRPSSPHLRFLTSSSSHKITLVSQVRDATLVVAEKLARTEKLLVAISLGKEIVSLSWVTESVKQERVCGAYLESSLSLNTKINGENRLQRL